MDFQNAWFRQKNENYSAWKFNWLQNLIFNMQYMKIFKIYE